jgi:hypothetical protein
VRTKIAPEFEKASMALPLPVLPASPWTVPNTLTVLEPASVIVSMPPVVAVIGPFEST